MLSHSLLLLIFGRGTVCDFYLLKSNKVEADLFVLVPFSKHLLTPRRLLIILFVAPIIPLIVLVVGTDLAKNYLFCPFFECSAKMNLNMDEIFLALVREMRKRIRT